MNPISVGVWTYGMGSDRYVSEGYKPKMPLEERIKQISRIEGVTAIEVTYPGDLNESNIAAFLPLLEASHLKIAGIGVELVCDPYWATGSISSPSGQVREHSVKTITAAMDFAASLGIDVVSLWLGQDGFDYFFQMDYAAAWENMVELLRRCADHNPSVKLGIEYKVSEPRLRCFVNSGAKALALCQSAGRDNLGITLDVGHALNAGENPAEIAAVLMSENRLFHLHLNDNYRIADDDMPVGSVHFLHFLELFFWLRRMGYDGWFSLDLYPYRDDPNSAVQASVLFMTRVNSLLDKALSDYSFSEGTGAPSEILLKLWDRLFAE